MAAAGEHEWLAAAKLAATGVHTAASGMVNCAEDTTANDDIIQGKEDNAPDARGAPPPPDPSDANGNTSPEPDLENAAAAPPTYVQAHPNDDMSTLTEPATHRPDLAVTLPPLQEAMTSRTWDDHYENKSVDEGFTENRETPAYAAASTMDGRRKRRFIVGGMVLLVAMLVAVAVVLQQYYFKDPDPGKGSYSTAEESMNIDSNSDNSEGNDDEDNDVNLNENVGVGSTSGSKNDGSEPDASNEEVTASVNSAANSMKDDEISPSWDDLDEKDATTASPTTSDVNFSEDGNEETAILSPSLRPPESNPDIPAPTIRPSPEPKGSVQSNPAPSQIIEGVIITPGPSSLPSAAGKQTPIPTKGPNTQRPTPRPSRRPNTQRPTSQPTRRPNTLRPTSRPTKQPVNAIQADEVPDVVNTFRPNGSILKIELKTDKYGQETSWTLHSVNEQTNRKDDLINSVGENYYQPNEEDSVKIRLSKGKYRFTLRDQFGDGFCCTGDRDGWYKLSLDDRVIIRGDRYTKEISYDILIGYEPKMSNRDQEWLEAHNTRREDWHGRYGQSYVPLQWSTSLAADAQSWANQLLNDCDIVGIRHESGVEEGENLAKNTSSGDGEENGMGQLYPADNVSYMHV